MWASRSSPKGRGAGNGETWEHGREPRGVGKNIMAILNPSTSPCTELRGMAESRKVRGSRANATVSADTGQTWSQTADRRIIGREADTPRILQVIRPVPSRAV